MIVNLDGNQTLRTGKKQAAKGEYFDALTTFARVDGYESLLNQVGCLTMTYDDTYALQMLGEVISRYVSEYDVFGDLSRLGDSVSPILRYYKSKPSFADGKITRKGDMFLIASYRQFEEYGDVMEVIGEELHRAFRYESEGKVFDVRSQEYFQHLRSAMQTALLRRQTSRVKDLEARIMDYSPDDARTLETKIMVCIHTGDKDKALAYASDLANLSEVSFSVLRRTIDLVIRFFDADVRFEVLRKLILRALELSADASDYYLRYFVLTAIVDLADDEVAFSCAVKLYERRKDCGCLALKLCFIAFYNAKRFDLCREILLEFSRALPRNAFWQVALSFLDSDCAFSRMKLKRGRGWYFNQPEQLVRFAESRLEATLRNGAPIGVGDCVNLDFLYEAVRGALLGEDYDAADGLANCMCEFISSVDLGDGSLFCKLALKQLATPLQEAFVNSSLLSGLIESGYRKKTVITLENNAYLLDLSKLTVDDAVFVAAFSLCACMRKVTVTRLTSAYAKLKTFKELPSDLTDDAVFKTAYFLLAVSYKDFASGSDADIFTPDERAWYDEYLRQSN